MTADEAQNALLNVARHRARGRPRRTTCRRAIFHHASSIAVAGTYEGFFTEDMFDEGQPLPSPYHRTKFESEKLVRTRVAGRLARVPAGARRRRLAHRRDGQDRRAVLLLQGAPEGALRAAGVVPARRPRGRLDEHRAGRLRRRRDGSHRARARARRPGVPPRQPAPAARRRRAQHVRARRPRAADGHARRQAADGHAPEGRAVVRDEAARAQGGAAHAARRPRHPGRGARAHGARPALRRARHPARARAATGIEVPPLETYADRLWDYWERNLDPDLFKDRSFAGAVNGKTVRDHRRVERHRPGGGAEDRGGRRHPAARRAHAGEARGGEGRDRARRRHGLRLHAPTCRTTTRSTPWSSAILADHPAVDVLVNNAGRSIRRSVEALLRPLPRLRADDPAQLPRHRAG